MRRRPDSAGAVLALALLDVMRALATRGTTAGAPAPELIDELLEVLARADGGPGGQEAARALGGRLSSVAGDAGERGATLAGVLGLVARRLAPSGCPPSTQAGATAWKALVIAIDRLCGSGVSALGHLPMISGRVLGLLMEEAAVQLPQRLDTDRRSFGEPGPVLRNIAVSRKLGNSIEGAFGFAVAPAYEAVYIYEPPGSCVPTLVDASGHEIVLHLTLEHTSPQVGSTGAELLVHLPGATGPTRFALRPGEAVALRERGTVHSWERLRPGERRTRLAVGFERAHP